MSSPNSTKSITITSIGHAEVTTVPVPHLPDDYILVRVLAVGLNPTDWKGIDGLSGGDPSSLLNCRVGCDYVGTVLEVGPAVTKPFAKGDRIAGVVHGCNQGVPEDGAFGEVIRVKGDLQIKVPEGMSDEEAAGLGIGITTVGQGLYQELGLPLPTSPYPTPVPILIYGGSTATGILGIQFAKLSGCKVITTCSPRNADYVRSLGADAVVDYTPYASDADGFAARIREEVGSDDLTLAWDCVGTEATARLCVAAMSRAKGGKYRSLLRVDDGVVKGINEKVDSGFSFAYFIFGENFKKWTDLPAKPEDFEFGKMFWELARQLLAEGKVKPARRDVNRGGKGLEGVLKGLQEMREGKVSGVKMVYTL